MSTDQMKKRHMTGGAVAGLFAAACVLMGFAVRAETLVWYHFDDAAADTVTKAGDVLKNAAAPADDPTRYQGIPLVNACTANTAPVTNQTKTAMMPKFADSFGPDYTWFDPATGQSGALNRSLYFNSTAGNHGTGGYTPSSMVIIEGSEMLTPTNFTVEMFFKADGTTTNVWRDFFIRENKDTYGKDAVALRLSSSVAGTLRTWNDDVTSYVESKVACKTRQDLGHWHHIAFVLDGANMTLELYLDYELASSKTLSSLPTYFTGGKYDAMTIGATCLSRYGCFKGWIDEFRLSTTALEPKQFLQLKSRQAIANSDADTYCYLSMNCITNWFGVLSTAPYNSSYFNEAAIADPPTVTMTGNGSRPLPQADTLVKAGETVRGSVTNQLEFTNPSSLHFVTNAGPRKSAVMSCYERDQDLPLPNYNFTAEFFVRFDGQPVGDLTYLFCQISGWSDDDSKYGGNWGVIYRPNGGLYAFCSDEVTRTTWTTIGELTITDSQWHHVAYVYDKDNSLVRFYVDYELLGQKSAVLKHGASMYYGKMFSIAGGYGTSAYQNNCWLDDVRVTRRVLAPQEFLSRSSKVNGNTLFWADFEDGTFAAKPYPVETLGSGSIWKSGGEVPNTTAAKWAQHGLADGNEKTIRDTNVKQLQVDNGFVDFGRILALEGEPEITVEAAIKLTSADAFASLIRYDNLRGEGTNILTLAVGQDGKCPFVRVDNEEGANQGHAFSGVDLTDGRWHPLALTIATNGANSVVTLYDRRVKVGEFAVRGHLATSRNTRLSVGRGGVGTSGSLGVVGMMDELRITKGVLSPTDMIGAVPYGMQLILR